MTPPEEPASERALVLVADLRHLKAPSVETVDALARLQLAAKQLGLALVVWTGGDALTRLIKMVGLEDVLTVVERPGSETPRLVGRPEVTQVADPPGVEDLPT
ncbi:MAG TPA: hypothetical protein VLX59_08800 [Acidimicrobiales bacterium]|nr:hypothetical protein [Acidimicrobiales bacterium]